MSTSPRDQAIFLDAQPDPVCAVFHPPAPDEARDTAVLLCPPFGWDEVSSYRCRREWAQRLAQAGYATLRISFPGTGESGGSPRDPQRLQAWTEALSHGARWLRAASGAERAAAIGIGLGGLVAFRAAAAGAPIDDLILWATPARARALVRQLRAFSQLEAEQFFEGLPPPPPPPPGELEAGGFHLSAETLQELDGLDLNALRLPNATSRRILLLARDRIPVDGRLRAQLEQWGAEVSVAPGDGYAAMTSHPQHARSPVELIERTIAWLGEASGPVDRRTEASTALAAGAGVSAELRAGVQATVRETHVSIDQPFGRLTGVLVEPLTPPTSDFCVLLLNAGAVRRAGPSRMWVEASRRWAARGIVSLRLDVQGIGDADGDTNPYDADASLYVPGLVDQVLAALDFVQLRLQPERFVLCGLCAGAYWSLHAALRDPRVSTALMVNPVQFTWDPTLAPARDFRRVLAQPTAWSKIRREASAARVRALALWMLGAPKRRLARMSVRANTAAETDMDTVVDGFLATRKRALLLFSDHEPLYQELLRSGRLARLEQSPAVTVEQIAVRDHTLRPAVAQGQTHELLDGAIERELAAGRPPALRSRASR